VDIPAQGPANAEGEAPEQVSKYFQVMDVSGGRSRPSMMPTVSSADQPELTEHFAVNVQLFDDWHDPVAELPPGCQHVYADSEVEWMNPNLIAPGDVLVKKLHTWRSCKPSATNAACLVLSGKEKAKQRYALTDPKCPVLTLVGTLLQRGWTSSKALVVHKDDAEHVFDSRMAGRMRWYYHLLVAGMAPRLPLAGGTIPSQEPMGFYRLLLANKEVRPGESGKYYADLLVEHKVKRGEPIEHDVLEDQEEEDLGHDGVGPIVLHHGPPEKEERRRRGGGGPIRAGRGGGGTGRGAGDKKPPVIPIEGVPPVGPGPDEVLPKSIVLPPEDTTLSRVLPPEEDAKPPKRRKIDDDSVPISGPDGSVYIFRSYPKPGGGYYPN